MSLLGDLNAVKPPHQPIETPKDYMRIEELSVKEKPQLRIHKDLKASTVSK
jgi:hypothetical protein